jgi:hypothetical protein
MFHEVVVNELLKRPTLGKERRARSGGQPPVLGFEFLKDDLS